MTIILTSCGGCSGHWSGYSRRGATDHPGGEQSFLCPTHQREVEDRNAAWVPTLKDFCNITGRPSGPFSRLVVVAIDGDQITVQPLGSPHWRTAVTRAMLSPARD